MNLACSVHIGVWHRSASPLHWNSVLFNMPKLFHVHSLMNFQNLVKRSGLCDGRYTCVCFLSVSVYLHNSDHDYISEGSASHINSVFNLTSVKLSYCWIKQLAFLLLQPHSSQPGEQTYPNLIKPQSNACGTDGVAFIPGLWKLLTSPHTSPVHCKLIICSRSVEILDTMLC